MKFATTFLVALASFAPGLCAPLPKDLLGHAISDIASAFGGGSSMSFQQEQDLKSLSGGFNHRRRAFTISDEGRNALNGLNGNFAPDVPASKRAVTSIVDSTNVNPVLGLTAEQEEELEGLDANFGRRAARSNFGKKRQVVGLPDTAAPAFLIPDDDVDALDGLDGNFRSS